MMRALGIGFLVLVLGFWGWVQTEESPPPQRGSDIVSVVPAGDEFPTTATTSREQYPPSDSPFSPPMGTPLPREWKKARATVFWVGEKEGDDNGFIHNRSSAWDVAWEQRFGGYDDPECRAGFYPCGFTPKENPFYIALPYNDLYLDGHHKDDPRLPPGPRVRYKSDLKNRWIAIRAGGITCYAQWQDVGPFGEDDIEYVFGDAQTPLNTRGERAGIDLSPAVRDCLKVDDLSDVEWRHVDINDVPQGPWSVLVTH